MTREGMMAGHHVQCIVGSRPVLFLHITSLYIKAALNCKLLIFLYNTWRCRISYGQHLYGVQSISISPNDSLPFDICRLTVTCRWASLTRPMSVTGHVGWAGVCRVSVTGTSDRGGDEGLSGQWRDVQEW